MNIQEMIDGATWIEHVRSRNATAACVMGGGVFALFFVTQDGRNRMVSAKSKTYPSDAECMQHARLAISDGAIAEDIIEAIIRPALVAPVSEAA